MTDYQRLRPEKSEVERLWADNNKAKELLDWLPLYSGKEVCVGGCKKLLHGLQT